MEEKKQAPENNQPDKGNGYMPKPDYEVKEYMPGIMSLFIKLVDLFQFTIRKGKQRVPCNSNESLLIWLPVHCPDRGGVTLREIR